MRKILTTVLLAAMTVSGTLNAQEMKESKAFTVADMSIFKSHNSNPWGLVYDGAITENIQGKVNIHPITYNMNGLEISANVYGGDCRRCYRWRRLHSEGGADRQALQGGGYAQYVQHRIGAPQRISRFPD